ncbi:aspartate aminotransferase family protein [Maritalea porphyrae]|uniref:Aspartate aminotransferase family protein n=1 Tax=Maritalea porphyrae TaxID=880732 RepID=A0ABQ5UV86_9HYPH|nr:aspartate aminotransferase family protein [Maritalea porphyrae]GLQ18306.1 aspartate aminotransferase family protein [Maritalea porphyrae]
MNYIHNHLPTDKLQALDAAHHIHPFSDMGDLNARGTRVITRADGAYIWDSDGNKLLDGMAGLWCVNVGYGRKELVDVATNQMMQLPYYNSFFQSTNVPAIELSAKLAELAPGDLNHVFYAGSGSEANDTNIRMARHYWASLGKPSKKVIISRHNAYHGSTVAAASLGGMAFMHAQGGLPIPDISHIAQPYWYAEGGDLSPEEFGLKCAQELEAEIERLGEDKVAAFIGEPIQGAGGVIIPPETYWPEIQRICDKYEILLIADEVICGFGRTGNWFGSQTFNIRPDIMTIAKGLSSGYLPIGGSMVSDHVAEVLAQKGGEFAHGYTYSGHPVAAAVALENLRILDEEKIVERASNEIAPYLKDKWLDLANHPLVGEARICGMVAGLELTPDKTARAPFKTPLGTAGNICRDFAIENGLVMRAVRDGLIISPPLVLTKPQVDELAEKVGRVLDQAHAKMRQEGML